MWLVGDTRYRRRSVLGIAAALAAGRATLGGTVASLADRIVTAALAAESAQAAGSMSLEYPAPLRTVNASNSSELAAALAAAQPGDHIVLADGVYSGNFALSTNGTAADPIVVRAANTLGASIDSLSLDAGYGWIYGCNVDYLQVNGSDCKTRRCRFSGATSYAIYIYYTGHRLAVEYCEVTGSYTKYGIECRFSGATGPTGLRVRKSYFHDLPDTTRAIRIGYSGQTGETNVDALIEDSLFENLEDTDLGVSIVNKASGIVYQYCHFKNIRLHELRHGDDNKIIACTYDSSKTAGLTVRSKRQLLHGVKLIGTARIRLMAGNTLDDSISGQYSQREPCVNGVVTRCNGPVDVGFKWGSESTPYPADGNSIEAHAGPLNLLPDQMNTTQSSTTNYPAVTPAMWTAADVGPLAS